MMRKMLILLVVVAMSAGAWAAPVVYNGSFQAPDTADFTEMPDLFAQGGTGWVFGSAAFRTGVSQENMTFTNGTVASDGDQMGYLWCGGDGISQVISGFEIGTTYDVSWTEGARNGYTAVSLEVLMDGVAIMPAHSLMFTGSLMPQTVQFTATATEHELSFMNTGGWDQMVHIDDVQIVPEPATIALLGLGGLALRRRKRA